jgi:ABC-type multidrug transport system ATPase subunit
MNKEIMLEVCNLTKNYGDFIALKNMSFSIEKGSIVGLLGKNGAGKTTLMKTVLGLLCQYDGDVLFDGNLINHTDPTIMRKISSLVDVRFYEDMTAYENLNYLLMADLKMNRKERKKKITELLELVGLENCSNKKVKSFSFGMKQRLALAQVFLHEADLIILDEPFVGLDPVGIEFMKNRLKELQKEKNSTIIFSSHQLDEVGDLADEIIAISNGSIKYYGTLEELQNTNKKYLLWFNGQEDEIEIPYNERELQKIIRENLEQGIEVSKIEVVENALYQLFV